MNFLVFIRKKKEKTWNLYTIIWENNRFIRKVTHHL